MKDILKDFRFDVEVTKANGDTKKDFYVEGYASTSDLDRQGDVILHSALEDAVNDLVNKTVFYGHEYNLNNAVGKVIESSVDTKGLKLKIFVSQWAEELRVKLQEGIINKFSIGGKVLKDDQLTKEEAMARGLVDETAEFDVINTIEAISLFEVSFVGVPANDNADVVRTFAKALHTVITGGNEMGKKKKEIKEDVNETTDVVDEQVTTPQSDVESVTKEVVNEEAGNLEVSSVADVTQTVDVEEVIKADEPELTDEQIKELVDTEGLQKEETKEIDILKKEDIQGLIESVAVLKDAVETLTNFIKEKVKSIEVSEAKKSLVIRDTGIALKKETVKTEREEDEEFANYLFKKNK